MKVKTKTDSTAEFIGNLVILIGLVALIIGLVVGQAWLFGWVLHLVWSSVAVAAFHAPALTLWQCVLIWCGISLVGVAFKGAKHEGK